ncbi:DNA-deoxyinosine glycosylase [Candidatus Woesearchaeota archaeon]|nr:DNA-deoxyinosine glycosylase [Candidatus Woesearchaeota archaeon]
METEHAKMKGLPPIMDKNTSMLILGTFPGEKSLEVSEYYAHPNNSFWYIMEYLLDKPFRDMEYKERTSGLLENRIGLWDVYSYCSRKGSSDSDIKDILGIDFGILDCYPLKLVAFNGVNAAANAWGLKTPNIILPSTSGANTHMSKAMKAKTWENMIKGTGAYQFSTR